MDRPVAPAAITDSRTRCAAIRFAAATISTTTTTTGTTGGAGCGSETD
jgi:hypothetical protein